MDINSSGNLIRLVCVTPAHVLAGRYQLWQQRFSDSLAAPSGALMLLEDCATHLTERPQSQGSDVLPGRVLVCRQNMLFAIPFDEPPRSENVFEKVTKAGHPINIVAGSWHISGMLHLGTGVAGPLRAWENLPAFVPITQARALHLGVSGMQLQGEVLVLCRSWVSQISPGE
jgi:hypothetical protein